MPRHETTPSRRSARRPKGRPRTGRRLFAFDREIGCRYVAGADEAGRGSLAGPLVAAAVLFDLDQLTLSDRRALTRLNDSKQHTAEMREELYPLVMRAAARSVIVSRCVRGIDLRGLHKTNLEALRTALLGVAVPGTVCLVDGFRVPEFGLEQRAVVDGDCRSAARPGEGTPSRPGAPARCPVGGARAGRRVGGGRVAGCGCAAGAGGRGGPRRAGAGPGGRPPQGPRRPPTKHLYGSSLSPCHI